MRLHGVSVSVLVLIPAGLAMTTALAATAAVTPRSSVAESRWTTEAPLVGTWRRTTTCEELVAALTKAGAPRKWVLEGVAGNGFIPGVTAPDQIADPTQPCAGAVPRRHSHFFRKSGAFGSLDWNGQQVDDGRYRIIRPGTVVISKVTFRYRIRGNKITFTPLVPKGCSSFRCAWAISVAYPGKTWQRVR
jgi:hypothetical protein